MKSQLEQLKERGLIALESHSGKVDEHLESGSRTFYIGFDPTADSLHIGHLFQIMNMYRLSQFGHKPICIIGGGTAMIGDPSGKTEMRKMMTPEMLETNRLALERQMKKLLKVDELLFLNNADWLRPLNYLDFMREYGVHFKINELIKKDIYRERLDREDGLTMFELNYICLQSYDYLELYRKYGCTLQLGATDQWSNILGGVELIKKAEGGEAFALTSPLLARSDGKKMGKSEEGAVWLDINKTSSYDFYQWWINLPDADVLKFMKIFTLIEIPEIEKLVSENIMNAKKVLAYETTKFVHGEAEAEIAKATSDAAFGKGGGNMEGLTEIILDSKFLVDGKIDLVNFLVESEILKSKREARDLIEAGGLYVNDEKVGVMVDKPSEPEFLLRVGKKKYFKIKI